MTVREGKVVRVKPDAYPEADAHYRRMCVKGFTNPQRIYDPDRVKYPMRRVGERGEGKWERISWDEAIDSIAEKFTASIEKYGGESIATWVSYASYGILNGGLGGGSMSVALSRFTSHIGGTRLGPGADYAEMFMMPLVGANGNEGADIENSRTIIIWGGNAAEANVNDWSFICNAREKGARLITIDPQFTASAMHSDIYVPILPGTDGAMALAMCNYIIDNGLMDEQFMRDRTVAPFLLKEDGTYLRMSDVGVAAAEGPVDATGKPTLIDPPAVWDSQMNAVVSADKAGHPALVGSYPVDGSMLKTTFQHCKDKIASYTLEFAARTCRVPEETIASLATIYAKETPAAILTYQGLGHHYNSHHTYKNLALLAGLTGNLAKPGAMLKRGAFGYFPFSSAIFSAPDPKPTTALCGMHLPAVVKSGKWGDKPLNIRCLWISNGNQLANESGRAELIAAVKQMDFIVVADVVMTDTARYADIVLPVPHAFEVDDFVVLCVSPYPRLMQKAVEPLYESLNDLGIFRLLAKRMGFGNLYDKTDEEYMEAFLDTPANNESGRAYRDFLKGSLVRCAVASPLVDGASGRFSTATGRLQFYLEKPAPRNSFGQEIDYSIERIPYYTAPRESDVDNALYQKYPFMGISEHHKYHIHSQLGHTGWLRELEPEPMVKINSQDAAAKGIADNNIVRVFNDRGFVVMRARVTDGIMPGVVLVPHGWQSDHFIDGHAQDLTSVEMNPFCSNSAFYDYLCQIEKY